MAAAGTGLARLSALVLFSDTPRRKRNDLSPPVNLEAIHRQIRGSRLEFFEGGHMFLRQDPMAFVKIIEFLS
jgi:hypothetical protein